MARKCFVNPFQQRRIVQGNWLGRKLLERLALAARVIIRPAKQMSTASYQGTPSRRANSVTGDSPALAAVCAHPDLQFRARSPHAAPEGARKDVAYGAAEA